MWWLYQFDSAVSHFGRSLENKLLETDKKSGKRLFTAGMFLKDKQDAKDVRGFFSGIGSGVVPMGVKIE